MANFLTLDEMPDGEASRYGNRYNGERVMIAYAETDPETLEILRGEVLEHSTNFSLHSPQGMRSGLDPAEKTLCDRPDERDFPDELWLNIGSEIFL